jgi:hypothetical protein
MDSLLRCAALLGLISLLWAACATTTQNPKQPNYRVSPDFGTGMSSARTIGIVPPVIRLYELSFGDKHEFKEDWSAKASESIGQGLVKTLVARGVAAKLITPSFESDASVQEARVLYEAVQGAIHQATYESQFPGPTKSFRYSVGDVSELVSQYGVDALLFACGSGEISSTGRDLATGASFVATLMTLAGPSYRYYNIPSPRDPINHVSLALVDRTGRVVWYDEMAGGSYVDLRNPAEAEKFLVPLLSELPRTTQ